MPPTGTIKRVFPGGNTSRGFVSFYDQIIGPEANRIFIIKGGPGVGKSTFMKAIGEVMIEKGYDLEYHHCSSDNNSLDGLVIPALNIAFMDGTAPHIVDPKNPGCVDEILHLGDYWDEEGLVTNKEQVVDLNRFVGRCFQRAYRYLKAAYAVYEEIESLYGLAFDPGKANVKTELLRRMLFNGHPVSGVPGRKRHLFGSAITPEGPINHLETIFSSAQRMIVIKGSPGSGRASMLAKLAEAATERGFYTECYHCAFVPDRIEHLWWPELQAGITTSSWPHVYTYPSSDAITIDMDETLDCKILESQSSAVDQAQKRFGILFDDAVRSIREAKSAHDEMEKYYVPYMDFAAIDRLRERVIERVIQYAKLRDGLKV